ncbi:single-pass membrane and coiled-coil domain-containing protein 3-like [Chanodichthys erythropterus]|uniref:single-pass membrane and coiled-coil domain-containing protein 3-like n=1 Tax=Chanodichthys erythropterus TaxID=933992 RepID=UPI00351E1D11
MWSDLFYPDNPKRREQLIRKSQKLQDLMKGNFYATNQLIDAMNEHLNCSFDYIELDENVTLQENCNVMIECMQKVQAKIEQIDKELKEKLDPTLYEKLRNKSLSTTDFQLISNIMEGVYGVATLGSTTLVSLLIDKGVILAKITNTFAKIGTITFASVGLGVAFMGIDMIVQAILGSVEREQLKEALAEYDKSLKEFEPASLKYQYNIIKVQVKIDEMNEQEM